MTKNPPPEVLRRAQAFALAVDGAGHGEALAGQITGRLQTLSLADAVAARDQAARLTELCEGQVMALEDYHRASGLTDTCPGCGEEFFPSAHRRTTALLGLEVGAAVCAECEDELADETEAAELAGRLVEVGAELEAVVPTGDGDAGCA